MEDTGVKRELAVILAAAAIAVAACAIQSTDLSLIEVGATRATVQSLLGNHAIMHGLVGNVLNCE